MVENKLIPVPTHRSLRVFAMDPSVSAQYDLAGVSQITIQVPWEENLLNGPIGEYIEVIDVDPASKVFYKPINLNDPHLLAQNGLSPSEGNPQFHQQMVYAVAMATIRHFEQALGRVAFWANRREKRAEPEEGYAEEFVRRLRIYPHALRDRNAYYSPNSIALLFGYFPIDRKDARNSPGTLVFTCLSHDIVAHETTHALLDGVHPRFNEPVNPDVHAFHEGFADIVALFQHFSYPGVLRDQIARTRGNLANENLLGQLAQQFGLAAGRGGALRDALGEVNPKTGKWERRKADFNVLGQTHEPHARGAILVAAVFDAFLTVYRARTNDLYRIATSGTGVLPEGEIHPDLSARLAEEAAACALRVLRMCIRAIDYCPPVGITFGAYLRGIVTADFEIDPDDTMGYRLAFIESFRAWGIKSRGVTSMSTTALLWPTHAEAMDEQIETVAADAGSPTSASFSAWDRGTRKELRRQQTRLARATLKATINLSSPATSNFPEQEDLGTLNDWNLEVDRFEAWKGEESNCWKLYTWLMEMKDEAKGWAESIGLVVDREQAPWTVFRKSDGRIAIEVHSVRMAQRRTPRGSTVTDLVVEITQRRRGYFKELEQKRRDEDRLQPFGDNDNGDFIYRAGCTLLMDPRTMEIRRVIKTEGDIADDLALARQRAFLSGGGLQESANAFASPKALLKAREPFAMLHAQGEA